MSCSCLGGGSVSKITNLHCFARSSPKVRCKLYCDPVLLYRPLPATLREPQHATDLGDCGGLSLPNSPALS